jgi:hypothetical protein
MFQQRQEAWLGGGGRRVYKTGVCVGGEKVRLPQL